jgi:hypothetical protein
MADLLFVVITFAFFVICVGYVHVCDRIIGPDPISRDSDADIGGDRNRPEDEPVEVTA